MENREDFIKRLKEANACLMVLTEDIKYPLEEQRKELLDGAAAFIKYLCKAELEDDLKKGLKELGRNKNWAEEEEE